MRLGENLGEKSGEGPKTYWTLLQKLMPQKTNILELSGEKEGLYAVTKEWNGGGFADRSASFFQDFRGLQMQGRNSEGEKSG